jgi:hypothetical protein
MDSIYMKEKWISAGVKENAWFTFYHDPFVLAGRFDENGTIIEKWEPDLNSNDEKNS